MEDKDLKVEGNKNTTVDNVLIIIDIALIVALVVLTYFGHIDMKFFIAIGLLIGIDCCIKPFIAHMRMASNTDVDKLFFSATMLGVSFVIGIGLLYTAYKVIFSEFIIMDKNFWFCNITILVIIITAIIRRIVKIINETIKFVKEKVPMGKVLCNFLYFVLVILVAFILPLSKYFDPRKVVSLDNIKRPSELFISEVANKQDDQLGSHIFSIGTITDAKFLEDFQMEISKKQMENVRNLDKLNYEIRNINENSYYLIMPTYKDQKFSRTIYGFDEGYIYGIRLHKNGEVILISLKNTFSPFDSSEDMFRLNFSAEFIDEIMNEIKNMDK